MTVTVKETVDSVKDAAKEFAFSLNPVVWKDSLMDTSVFRFVDTYRSAFLGAYLFVIIASLIAVQGSQYVGSSGFANSTTTIVTITFLIAVYLPSFYAMGSLGGNIEKVAEIFIPLFIANVVLGLANFTLLALQKKDDATETIGRRKYFDAFLVATRSFINGAAPLGGPAFFNKTTSNEITTQYAGTFAITLGNNPIFISSLLVLVYFLGLIRNISVA
jgi:uncharacterized membrane protein YhaH (DUF805 family)